MIKAGIMAYINRGTNAGLPVTVIRFYGNLPEFGGNLWVVESDHDLIKCMSIRPMTKGQTLWLQQAAVQESWLTPITDPDIDVSEIKELEHEC